MAQHDIKGFLVSFYQSNGVIGLKQLQEIANDPVSLEWVALPGRWVITGQRRVRESVNVVEGGSMMPTQIAPVRAFRELARTGVLTKGDNDIANIDPVFLEAVDGLVSELEDKDANGSMNLTSSD